MLKIDIKKAIRSAYGEVDLDLKLDISDGEFIAVTGESGIGKSTLLRSIAGLEEADGVIEFDGTTWLKDSYSLPPQKREIGFVFQNYALFENMSVEENLLYVKNDRAFADYLLDSLGLFKLKDRSVKQLSGGQQQRVAILRALMNRPKLLILDEPFGALDREMRRRAQALVLKYHRDHNIKSIIVTHNLSDIYKLATKVIEIDRDGNSSFSNIHTYLHNSLKGEIIDIKTTPSTKVAVVDIGSKLIEVQLKNADRYKIGDLIEIGK